MAVNPEYLITSLYPETYEELSIPNRLCFRVNILAFFEFVEMLHNERWAPDLFIGEYRDKANTIAVEFASARGLDDPGLIESFKEMFLTTYPTIYEFIDSSEFFTSTLSFIEGSHYALVIEKSPREFRPRRKCDVLES